MKAIFVALMLLGTVLFAGAAETSIVLSRARAGKSRELDQAFALYAKTDGASAEDIDLALGESLRSHPKAFLTALKKNRSKVQNLGAIVGNLGPDFVDDLQKQKAELEIRLAAVVSVKDASLKDIRSECEAELNRQISQRALALKAHEHNT